ncbi:MAG: glycoside hydrolase family 18 [Prevotella sp.]|jgi:hypothetical protein|nr:glycoside hydrolase family 18 [Prevotella sp.]MCI1282329.1 glycoside hydrolase family 18 [Prevotella sp.]
MKILKYILPVLFISAMVASCDTDDEAVEVQNPYTVSPQYYQNLRDYKATDHSIAWGWFSDYTTSYSMATRFLGLPDSLDICSLWGGIPTNDSTLADGHYVPDVYKEMKFVQQTKGTKMVVPTIVRIRTFPEFYDSVWVAKSNPDSAMQLLANHLLAQIFVTGVDGIDLDYEPEGDPLSGSNMDYFVKYLGKFVGPAASDSNKVVAKLGKIRWVNKKTAAGKDSLVKETYYEDYTIVGDPTKLLCIDYYSAAPSANTLPYTNWYVNQTYGGSPGGKPFSSCPASLVVYTENVGDNWKAAECGKLLTYARYKPATGRKGGFGAFFMHRDYINAGYGCLNYANMRHGIQIQNPAIH